MSEVASLELCKKLFELSGWDAADFWYWGGNIQQPLLRSNEVNLHKLDEYTPAYSLGFLLRQICSVWLPRKAFDRVSQLMTSDKLSFEGAAAKLAIELWKQGILK